MKNSPAGLQEARAPRETKGWLASWSAERLLVGGRGSPTPEAAESPVPGHRAGSAKAHLFLGAPELQAGRGRDPLSSRGREAGRQDVGGISMPCSQVASGLPGTFFLRQERGMASKDSFSEKQLAVLASEEAAVVTQRKAVRTGVRCPWLGGRR